MSRLYLLHEELAKIPQQQLGRRHTYLEGQFDGGAQGASQGTNLARVEVPHYLAQDWTVTLAAPSRSISTIAVGAVNVEGSTDINNGFAIIEWGNGGVNQQAFVDWRQGACVRVFGHYVKVSSFLPQPVGLDSGGALTVGASISPGSCPGPLPTFSTVMNTAGSPGGTVTSGTISVPVGIPRFAYEVIAVQRKNQANDTYNINFSRISTTVPLASCQVGPGSTGSTWRAGQWFPVPRDATVVTYENTDLTDFTGVELIFRLAL